MTDWPEAVRKYERTKQFLEESSESYSWVTLADEADPAIAALEAEVERLKWMLDFLLERSFPLSKDEWRADLAARYEKEQHGSA